MINQPISDGLMYGGKIDSKIDTNDIPKSRLSYYKNRWLSEFYISQPRLVKGYIHNHHVYPITYMTGNKKFIILRKFADFQSLRQSLQRVLPCLCIHPLLKKSANRYDEADKIKYRLR